MIWITVAFLLLAPPFRHANAECGSSTHELFGMALSTQNIVAMRKHAVCATSISDELPPTMKKQFATSVITTLLTSSHPTKIPQLSTEDFDMLRTLIQHGIMFTAESLREAVLMCHIPLVQFLLREESGIRKSLHNDPFSWQIIHAIFMPRLGITAIGKMLLDQNLRVPSVSSEQQYFFHGNLNLHFLTTASKTYARLFKKGTMRQIFVKDLRKGANEIHAVLLDLFLEHPEFVANLCSTVTSTSTTMRTVLHLAAASSDPLSISKILLVSKKHKECSALSNSIMSKDAFGFTAADLAGRAGDYRSVELLLRESSLLNLNDRITTIFQKFDPRTKQQKQHGSSSRKCDFDKIDIDQLNSSYFYHNYYMPRKPLLVQRGCRSYKAIKKWTLSYLDRHLNVQKEVLVSHIPYGNQFGMEEVALPSMRSLPRITNTSSKHIPYVFDGSILSQSPRLLQDFPSLPSFAEPPLAYFQKKDALGLHLNPPQLYVGSTGSGSPMHFHSDAINACFKGEKMYVLLPPVHAVYSIDPVMFWLKNQEKELIQHALFCTQQKGDILYIPGMYSHGVLNKKKVIGVATEMLGRHGEELLWF